MAARVTIVGRRPGRLRSGLAALAAAGWASTSSRCAPSGGTPVHQTGDLAELVCSNSLRGNALDQAAGLLKEEMRRMDSLIVRVADEVKVPAGSALAVDRGLFARRVTEAVEALPGVRLHREEVLRIPDDPLTIVATGPLTSDPLAQDVAAFVGQAHLYFYDAVSPVVEADSHRLREGLPRLALRQGRRRLRQLRPDRGGVPGLLRGAHAPRRARASTSSSTSASSRAACPSRSSRAAAPTRCASAP